MKALLCGKKIQRTVVVKGSSTIEFVIAFAVLILSLTAVISVTFGNQSVSVDTQTNTEALSMAQNMLEQARIAALFEFQSVNPATTIAQRGPLLYTKDLEVEQEEDLFTKKITAHITWPADGNRTLNTQLTTLLTNPDATSGGDTCSSVLEGDWTNPQKTEYEFGADILNDTSSGFPITSIQSFNHKLYVTVSNEHGNNDGTFFILDIADPSIKPVFLDELDNNPNVSEGLNDVAVDGDHYAYVANAYGANFTTCVNTDGTNLGCGQLQVIDIGVSPPVVVFSYKIPGVTGSAGQGIGTRVFYKDGIVYLGLAKATGSEFHTIDVGGGGTPGASPLNPLHLGEYEINNGVNAIQVRSHYAYIASPNDEELKILDVSDPTFPTLVGGFDAPGGGGNNGNGKSILLVGNTLYLGRTLLNGDEFYILNNENSEMQLPVLGSKNILNGGSNSSVNGIVIRDYLAFLITHEEFQTWRIDNPADIMQYANPLTLPPGEGGGLNGTAADCEGNYIFVGSESSNDKGYLSVITGGL